MCQSNILYIFSCVVKNYTWGLLNIEVEQKKVHINPSSGNYLHSRGNTNSSYMWLHDLIHKQCNVCCMKCLLVIYQYTIERKQHALRWKAAWKHKSANLSSCCCGTSHLMWFKMKIWICREGRNSASLLHSLISTLNGTELKGLFFLCGSSLNTIMKLMP